LNKDDLLKKISDSANSSLQTQSSLLNQTNLLQQISVNETITNSPQDIYSTFPRNILQTFLPQTTISSIKIEYPTSSDFGQTLITLNQKQTLDQQLTYRIAAGFNFPLFVEALQAQYGRLDFVTLQFAQQNYLSLVGGTINGNLTVRGLLNAYGISIDDIVGKTWSLNIGEAAVPLQFSRSNVAVFEIPYQDDGNFYFRDFSDPTNNFITINPTYKQIVITYGNVEIANSDQWTSSYTTVLNNSAVWDSTYTSVTSISANFDSVYTTLNSNSANWNSTYTTVLNNSASWGTGGGGGGINLGVVTNYLSTNNVLLSSANILGTLTVQGSVSTSSNIFVSGFVVSQLPVTNTSLTSYNLSFQDRSDLLIINTATTCNVNILNDSSIGFNTGDQINIARFGSGSVSVSSAAGVTLRSAGSRKNLRDLYSVATVVKLSANDWLLFGDLS
jgi:hypothetical protein